MVYYVVYYLINNVRLIENIDGYKKINVLFIGIFVPTKI